MPAPTSDTFAMSSSWVTSVAPIDSAMLRTIVSDSARSAIGIVKLMSVVPCVDEFVLAWQIYGGSLGSLGD